MTTTLEIDDDVLDAAQELAVAEALTIGRVISSLARMEFTRSQQEPPP